MSFAPKTKDSNNITDEKNSDNQRIDEQQSVITSPVLPKIEQTRKLMTNGDILEGKFVNGKLVEGKFTHKLSGIIREGKFISDKKFEGKYTFPSGEVQKGVFINNDLIKGEIITKNMILYKGSFINMKLCGDNCSVEYPVVIQTDGDNNGGNKHKYNVKKEEGRFFEDILLEGVRVYHYSPNNIKKEEGKFVDNILVEGKREYIGTVSDEDKNPILSEEGTFINNRIAEGKRTKKNFTCEGEFTNDFFTKGKVTWHNDDVVYEGTFTNGTLNGIGKYTSLDKTYEGEFVNGRFNGNGITKFNDGTITEGKFINGEFVEGKYINSNGTMYEGKFNSGYHITSGKITYRGGKCVKMSSSFNNGKINGHGVWMNISEKYVGIFSDDKLDGYGKLYCRTIDMESNLSLTNTTVEECKIPYELKAEGLFKDDKLIDGLKYYTLLDGSKIAVTTGGVVHKMNNH